MMPPASTLVVDAAVLVAAARGRSTGALLEAARKSVLVTTDRVVEGARRRIEFGLKRADLLPIVEALAAQLTIVPVAALGMVLPASEIALREAVPSRNGSSKDAHVLSLAWCTDADIWSTDRDFAGTGVATWSTPNLMRGLAERE